MRLAIALRVRLHHLASLANTLRKQQVAVGLVHDVRERPFLDGGQAVVGAIVRLEILVGVVEEITRRLGSRQPGLAEDFQSVAHRRHIRRLACVVEVRLPGDQVIRTRFEILTVKPHRLAQAQIDFGALGAQEQAIDVIPCGRDGDAVSLVELLQHVAQGRQFARIELE